MTTSSLFFSPHFLSPSFPFLLLWPFIIFGSPSPPSSLTPFSLFSDSILCSPNHLTSRFQFIAGAHTSLLRPLPLYLSISFIQHKISKSRTRAFPVGKHRPSSSIAEPVSRGQRHLPAQTGPLVSSGSSYNSCLVTSCFFIGCKSSSY